MSENTPKLGHLRALAVQCKSLIASVASAAADAIGEVAAAKADKAEFIATSLSAENWAENADPETSAAGYAYRYALPVAEATAKDSADCIIAERHLPVASACGLCQTTDVADGLIYFYAAEIPAANISIQVRLIPGAA